MQKNVYVLFFVTGLCCTHDTLSNNELIKRTDSRDAIVEPVNARVLQNESEVKDEEGDCNQDMPFFGITQLVGAVWAKLYHG